MLESLSQLNGAQCALLGVVAVCLTVFAAVAAVQWRKVRQTELEITLKRELLGQGLAPSEVERLVTSAPQRKGLLEQFGAMPMGSKVILFLVFFFGMGMLIGPAIELIHALRH